MILLILIPAVIVFLYTLYKLVKDDYVFIRKGISLEQAFDIAFICLWIGLVFSRLFYLIFNASKLSDIFIKFLSIRHGGFSLLGAVIGGLIALYLLSRIKKLPFGRVGDFLSLSLLFSFPVGFLMSAFVSDKTQMLYHFLSAVLYILLVVFFMQFLYPKLMSRTIREGTVSLLFLGFFSVITLLVDLLMNLKHLQLLLSIQTATGFLLLFLSIFLFLRLEQPFTKTRRTQLRP